MGELALTGGTPLRTRSTIEWPIHGKEEVDRVTKVVESGKWWWGENVKEFEQRFAEYHGAKHGITCSNGTIGLILSLKALGITAGDEVIVPAYTFVASATAVTSINAIPVFADVEQDSVNIDFESAEKLVTPHTKAIMVVHFAGLPVDMDKAWAFAKKHNIRLVEDACHSWGTQWKGKGTGALGDIGSFSFQMSKNITAGEGGIVLTDDDELAAIVRSYTHVGRMEGKPWYDHYLLSGNNRMTEMQAALLLAQMDRLPEQTLKREKNAAILNEGLSQVPGISVSPQPAEVTRRSWHIYIFWYNAEEFGGLSREKFLEALQAEGVPCSGGYIHPVHKNPCFQELNASPRPEDKALADLCNERGIRYDQVSCPVSENLCSQLVWMGHPVLLEEPSDMETIVEAVRKVQRHQHEIAGQPVAAAV